MLFYGSNDYCNEFYFSLNKSVSWNTHDHLLITQTQFVNQIDRWHGSDLCLSADSWRQQEMFERELPYTYIALTLYFTIMNHYVLQERIHIQIALTQQSQCHRSKKYSIQMTRTCIVLDDDYRKEKHKMMCVHGSSRPACLK